MRGVPRERRAMECSADVADRAIDPFQRPMCERGSRAAAVRLLVVAQEIRMDHLRAALDVQQHAEADQLAHQAAHHHPRRDEAQL